MEAAWQRYAKLCRYQDELLEIQRCLFASRIVRANGAVIKAAVSASLLARLEEQALGVADRITAENPHLRVESGDQAERLRIFLARAEASLAADPGDLARVYFTDGTPGKLFRYSPIWSRT